MATDKPTNLAAKLAAVMGEIPKLPKSGWNDFHKYAFASEADVSEAVRSALANAGIVMIPQVRGKARRIEIESAKGSRWITELTVDLLLTDGTEQFTVTVIGQGEDSGDKGANKALTAAVKYGLLKTFLIPTGDDPDAHGESSPQPKQAKSAKADRAKTTDLAGEQIRAALAQLDESQAQRARERLATMGITSPADVTAVKAARALAIIAEIKTEEGQAELVEAQ